MNTQLHSYWFCPCSPPVVLGIVKHTNTWCYPLHLTLAYLNSPSSLCRYAMFRLA